jgi:hypothetical protein
MEVLTDDSKRKLPLLTESYRPGEGELQVLEESIGETGKKRLVLKSPLGVGGRVNGNRRVYPAPIYKREALKVKTLCEQGELLGAVDHPAPDMSEPRIMGSGVLYRKIEVAESADGKEIFLSGEAVVLDNDEGRTLRSVIEACQDSKLPLRGIGFSTRGFGTAVKKEWNGVKDVQVINDDYEMVTIDVVLRPSEDTARVSQIALENQQGHGPKEMEMSEFKTYKEFREKHPELVEQFFKDAEFVGEAAKCEAVVAVVEKGLREGLETQAKQIAEAAKRQITIEARAAADEEWEAKLNDAKGQNAQALAVLESLKRILKEHKVLADEPGDGPKDNQTEAFRAENAALRKQIEDTQKQFSEMQARLNEKSMKEALEEATREDDPHVRKFIVDTVTEMIAEKRISTTDAVIEKVESQRAKVKVFIESKAGQPTPVPKARTEDPEKKDPVAPQSATTDLNEQWEQGARRV